MLEAVIGPIIQMITEKLGSLAEHKWARLKRPAQRKIILIGIAAIVFFVVVGRYFYREFRTTITSVSLSQKSMTLSTGETTSLSATVLYSDNSSSHDVIWISGNPEVVQVDEEGHITALAKGSAEITAQASHHDLAEQAVCLITVTASLSGYVIDLERTELDNYVYIHVQPNEDTVTGIQLYARSPSGQILPITQDEQDLYHVYTEAGTWTVYAELTDGRNTYHAQKPEDFVEFEVSDISAGPMEAIQAGLLLF